jgi:hypothetical protein
MSPEPKSRNKIEARKIAGSLQEEIDAQIAAEAVAAARVIGGLTWSEASLIHMERAKLKASTKAGYGYLLPIVLRGFGDFRLNDLTHDDLRRFAKADTARQSTTHPSA